MLPPSHLPPPLPSVAPEHQIRSSSDMLTYLGQDPVLFAFAFAIAYASEIVFATEKLQQEPQLPWFTTGVKQPPNSCLKS